MTLMSLRSRSYVNTSMVLQRPDHLFIHNYKSVYSLYSAIAICSYFVTPYSYGITIGLYYPSHTRGTLSPHPSVLHHQLPTSRNY